MFDSVIQRRYLLDQIWKNTQYLCEVYGDIDFSVEDQCPNLYCLVQQDIDKVSLYYKLSYIYTRGIKLHTTTESMDIMLCDKKLLWRKGVWYV